MYLLEINCYNNNNVSKVAYISINVNPNCMFCSLLNHLFFFTGTLSVALCRSKISLFGHFSTVCFSFGFTYLLNLALFGHFSTVYFVFNFTNLLTLALFGHFSTVCSALFFTCTGFWSIQFSLLSFAEVSFLIFVAWRRYRDFLKNLLAATICYDVSNFTLKKNTILVSKVIYFL